MDEIMEIEERKQGTNLYQKFKLKTPFKHHSLFCRGSARRDDVMQMFCCLNHEALTITNIIS